MTYAGAFLWIRVRGIHLYLGRIRTGHDDLKAVATTDRTGTSVMLRMSSIRVAMPATAVRGSASCVHACQTPGIRIRYKPIAGK